MKDHLRVMLRSPSHFCCRIAVLFENMSHKLVVHFADVIPPSSQALLHHQCNLLQPHVALSWRCCTDLPRNSRFFKNYTHTYIRVYIIIYILYIYVYIYKYVTIFKGRISLIDTDFAQFVVIWQSFQANAPLV